MVTTAGSSSYSTFTSRAASSARVLGLRRYDRDRLAEVLHLSGRDHGPVIELRPKTRRPGGHVRGGEQGYEARNFNCLGQLDHVDPSVRHGQRHQLAIELIRQMDVSHVALRAVNPALATNARDGRSDHWSTGG